MEQRATPARTWPAKHVFLYLWLCNSATRAAQVVMARYAWFDTPEVPVSRMSYRDFTQRFVEPIVRSGVAHLHYECEFSCSVAHSFPVSMRRLMDTLPLCSDEDMVLHREGNVLRVKRRPKLMDPEGDDAELARHIAPDTLHYRGKDATMHSDTRQTRLTATSRPVYDKLRCVVVREAEAVSRVDPETLLHVFIAARPEVNFDQALEWLRRQGVRHSVSREHRSAVAEDAIPDARCTIVERILASHRCFDNGEYEVFRLKGSRVLAFEVTSHRERGELEASVQSVLADFDPRVKLAEPELTDADVANIARLRSRNSVLFDSAYCRRAPPRVQPVVIESDEVEAALLKGKMVLRYQGAYYTTKDRDVSGGHDYLGMINRFGDYDPSRPYVPMLRTYRTNHLLSSSFKEFKAYLLRHSPSPHSGMISPEDLLLPSNMAHLYRSPLYNPDPQVAGVHSKKTVITKSLKVQTAEVPDYVKALLGTTLVRRHVHQYQGTGLLEACGVDKRRFTTYVLQRLGEYEDLVTLDESDVRKALESGDMDHRLYGRCIEDFTGYNVLVFGTSEILPYRCSMFEQRRYVLLYTSERGTYDLVTVDTRNKAPVHACLERVRDACNSQAVATSLRRERRLLRPVDPVEVLLRVTSWATLWCEASDVSVVYEVIEEAECQGLADALYATCHMPMGSIARGDPGAYNATLVTTYRSTSRVAMNLSWLASLLRPLVVRHDYAPKSIVLRCPVDLSIWHPWRYALEDTMYFSADCYALGDREELCTVEL